VLRRQGAPASLRGIFQNVTERKMLEGLKRDFMTMVTHELRTPLTSIFAALQMLETGAIDGMPEEARELIAIADRNSQRLSRLIDDILDFEGLESGRLTLSVQPMALMPLIDHAVAVAEPLALHCGVRVEVVESLPGVTVEVDAERLIQVLGNLISNGIKFSWRGQVVELVVHLAPEKVQIEILDRGPGVPEAFHEKIFEKFLQVDSPMTRSAEGTGLGLSIARSILTKLRGEVRYRDREGGGSKFVITLPEWREAEGAAETS